MLDRHLHPRLKPLLHRCVGIIDKPAITPDGLTLVGFAIGVLALPFLALGWYLAALVAIVLNRLFDGLDGALARRRGLSDAGDFSISRSIFILRPCAVWFYSCRSGTECAGRQLAVVRVYWHR